MGNRLIFKRKQVGQSLESIQTALRATRDERNRIIRILENDKSKVSQRAMLAIMEGKKQ